MIAAVSCQNQMNKSHVTADDTRSVNRWPFRTPSSPSLIDIAPLGFEPKNEILFNLIPGIVTIILRQAIRHGLLY